jgi:hypothetical protein
MKRALRVTSSVATKIHRRLPAISMLLVLTGCALVYQGKYDWDEGWREGYVVKVETGAVPIVRGGCVHRPPLQTLPPPRYAQVKYQNEGRVIRNQNVPIPENANVQQGDRVYFNINDCSEGLVPARP